MTEHWDFPDRCEGFVMPETIELTLAATAPARRIPMTTPAPDPAALASALATVRSDDYSDPAAWRVATELLAREFVRRLDAGELWRVRPCYECLGDGCQLCDGAGRTYEPLIVEESK